MSSLIFSESDLTTKSELSEKNNVASLMRKNSSLYNFDNPILTDDEMMKIKLEELKKRNNDVKMHIQEIQKHKEKKLADEASMMAKYNNIILKEEHSKCNNDKHMEKEITDLAGEVHQLNRKVCDLVEKVGEQNLWESKYSSECHIKTVTLCSNEKKKSSVYNTSKAYWDKMIESSSIASANVSGRGRKCSPMRNASKSTRGRPVPCNSRTAALKQENNAEYCPLESSPVCDFTPNRRNIKSSTRDEPTCFVSSESAEMSDFSLSCRNCKIPKLDKPTCLLPLESDEKSEFSLNCHNNCQIAARDEPIRLDGKLEISLADTVLPQVQTMIRQECMSKLETNQVLLEKKFNANKIKLDMIIRDVNEMMSANEKHNIEGSKFTDDKRKQSENAVNGFAAEKNSACTFANCVCRLIEGNNVATQVVDDSHGYSENNDRSRAEQCTRTLDSVPKKMDQCSQVRVDTVNCGTAKGSGESNIKNKSKKDGQTVQKESDRKMTKCMDPRLQLILDCIASIKQYKQRLSLTSTRTKNDGVYGDNCLKNFINLYSSSVYCDLDSNNDDQVKRR